MKNKAVITAVFHSVHLCVRCLDTERKYTVAGRGSSISDGSVYYNVCVLYRAFRMDHLLCEEKGNAVYRGRICSCCVSLHLN